MEPICRNHPTTEEPAWRQSREIRRSNKLNFRLIGRYKVAFLFFLTRLILIRWALHQGAHCVRTDRTSAGNFNVTAGGGSAIAERICKIFKPHPGVASSSKMAGAGTLRRAIPNLNGIQNRTYAFVQHLKSCTSNPTIAKELKEGGERNLQVLLSSYESQPPAYGAYQSSYTVSPSSYPKMGALTYSPTAPSYGGMSPQGLSSRDEFNTFVSSHYRNMGEDIVEYLNRKKIEFTESPVKYTLKFCPFCPPHRFKSDNLFKHEIFKNSGNSYCHRCGYKGSLFDFKAHMGDLPSAFDIAADPITSPFGPRKVAKDPDVTIEDVNKFEDNLFNNAEYKCVYDYLTQTRGISPQVLRKYHVGAGTFKFKSMTGKLEQEKCVVFPWLSTPMPPTAFSSTQDGEGQNEGSPGSDFISNEAQGSEDSFDYNMSKKTKLTVNRIKVRSIYDKSKMKILPRGGTWGMFGAHLIPQALQSDSIVLSEGELDAMSIYQATGRVALSLPNGANSLPLPLLPKLERFNEIYLWMDFDAAGQSSISHFANKLGIQRVKIVHPLNPTVSPTAPGAQKSATTKGKGRASANAAAGAADGARSGVSTKSLKDANEVLLNTGVDMNTYFKNATVMNHSQILSFNDIRQLVYNELSDPISTCGIKSITMPGLSNLLKGHRRGELTVWTGSTGSGKTTLLSQLSLDYCLQGVSTLWGSFEINNVRLAKTMLRQFSGRNLENSLNEFDYYANKFNELPLRFLKFHGSTNIDIVLDAMDYAVYVHDVQHIIIDNLQFMLSNYSAPSQGGIKDVYELQNRTIEKFRRFATNKNVHLSLVVHPRKEADGIQLGLSSVFGSVKSTQEADNVIILQNIFNESRCIDVKKNRFAGLLGRVYFKFDPVSLTAQEFKVTEYLNEYIANTPAKGANVTSKGAKDPKTLVKEMLGGTNQGREAGARATEIRERVIMSNIKPTLPNSRPNLTQNTTTSTNSHSVAPASAGSQPPMRVSVADAPSAIAKEHVASEARASPGGARPGTSYLNPGAQTPHLSQNFGAGYALKQDEAQPSGYYKDRERNNFGLVGIDLLNLKPITQQINRIIHSNYSTSQGPEGDQSRVDSELSGVAAGELASSMNQPEAANHAADVTSTDTLTTGSGSGTSTSGGEGGPQSGDGSQGLNGRKGKSKKKDESEQEPEDPEYLKMRGIVITRNSSIKEMRDFVKKNGLGELVKTAGKGIKKEAIYENIRSIIPNSAIMSREEAPAEPEGASGPEAAPTAPEDLHPFGVSTSESMLRTEHVRVVPNKDLRSFKLKYLTKLPKSLYSGEEKPEAGPAVEEAPAAAEGVDCSVYYSAAYDPLLIDGVIYVDEYAKLEALEPLFRNAKLAGVDIETTGLDHNANKIRLIQLSVPNQPTVIVDLFKINANLEKTGSSLVAEGPDSRPLLRCEWLRDLFARKDATKVFHNGKFDINFLRVYGFEFDGPVFDTMVASKLLVASRFISCKLTHVSERYLNIVLDKTQQYSDWSTLQLFEEQLLYSARDAFVLLPLYVILEHLLKINNLSDIAQVENKCILATSDMELNGIGVDQGKLERLQQELKEEHLEISNDLHRQLNEEINLNSQKQVLEKLQALNIQDRSKRKLISDTSESTLIRNASNPIISSLREYRKANKALTAFTQKLPNHINPETNRIYPNYNQLGAESGRFSCDGPNLQQVPREKKFRECFVAAPGNKFVIADFSQIELRIAAEIANDEKMIQAYQDKVDLHSLTASILKNKRIEEVTKEERQLAKAVNFGLIFGMSVNGLRMYAETSYKVKLSQKEARDVYTSFFNNFRGILNWHESVKGAKPTMVRTLGNRLSVFDSFSFTRSLNYPVQGTSADITKETMARLVDLVKPLGAKIIICVHDEIILEVPEARAQEALDLLLDTMVKSGQKYLKKVPVEAMGFVGDSWADKE